VAKAPGLLSEKKKKDNSCKDAAMQRKGKKTDTVTEK